ncbi:type 1 phosphatidylinositol 4,5-bisphosphate 4-phosphatase-like isoform X2 [Temnothorax americanus]|uniref:type 1 phosphatidylinositol 4,5-bisphosphate 4-phosphatase-like isoform X2 n=1 Tax=Temnothorax americanus TaxID=1964332 RepID=UPI00406927A8
MANFVIALKRNRENNTRLENECQPIRDAPPGKMYVRCPCNCLFLCKSSSQCISCPKPNCKRIINLTDLTSNPIPGMRKVGCAYCHDTYLFNTLNKYLVRCPHCRKLSSVGPNGPNFARRKGIVLIFVGIITLVIAIALTVDFYWGS